LFLSKLDVKYPIGNGNNYEYIERNRKGKFLLVKQSKGESGAIK
jgi:hypothetical protein